MSNDENEDILSKHILDFELSVRTLKCLVNENILTVRDITQKTVEDFLKIPKLGRKSFNEIKWFLKVYNLEPLRSIKLEKKLEEAKCLLREHGYKII